MKEYRFYGWQNADVPTVNEEYKKYFILGLFTIIYLFLNGMVESNIYMEKVNQMTFFILGLALNEKFFCNNKKDNKE